MVNRPKDYANEIEDIEQLILTKTKKKPQKMDDKQYASKLATALKKELALSDKVNHFPFKEGFDDSEDFVNLGSTSQDPGPVVEGWRAVVQKLPIPQSFQ
jgi:hypothetical protein